MASRISYNGKFIDLTAAAYPLQFDAYRLQFDYMRSTLRNQSASGIVETLNVRADVLVAFGFRYFVNANAADATLKRNLQQWFMWAQKGGTWTFARDSGDMVLTTLSAAEAAGQTVLSLTSTTGMVAGRQYVIRSTTDTEVVKVASVDSAVQVTLTETLNHSYASGSRFRSEQYWPARLIDNRNPIREVPFLHYDFDLTFIEDVNTL